jgi:hypothetical protein
MKKICTNRREERRRSGSQGSMEEARSKENREREEQK